MARRKTPPPHPLLVYRSTHGLSMLDLAEIIGVTAPAICRWESGIRKPSIQQLAAITRATGITAKELRPDLADALEAAE